MNRDVVPPEYSTSPGVSAAFGEPYTLLLASLLNAPASSRSITMLSVILTHSVSLFLVLYGPNLMPFDLQRVWFCLAFGE